jgi:hypothetical protein
VQELAAGVVEPPSQFVLQEQDRPESLLLASNLPEPIPVIDLSRLAAAEEASKLRSALQTWGLFLVSRSVHYLPICIVQCLLTHRHGVQPTASSILCRLPTMG